MNNYFFNKTRNLFLCSLAAINTILSINPLHAQDTTEQYGFVSKLPNDVEGFAADFKSHDLWVKLANSNWSSELLSSELVKNQPMIQQFLKLWDSPAGKQVRDNLESTFGVEFEVVLPTGFSEKFSPLAVLYNDLVFSGLYNSIVESVRSESIQPLSKFYDTNASSIFSSLATCEIPPMIFVSKPMGSKASIDKNISLLIQALKLTAPYTFESDSFMTSDKSEFAVIRTTGAKIIPQGYLKDILKDQPDSDKIIAALNGKQLELTFGWMGDHLVVSIGSDHNHVRFAANIADSALNIPEVKTITTRYAEKKPHTLRYANKYLLEQSNNTKFSSRPLAQLYVMLTGWITPKQIKEFEGLAENLSTVYGKHFVRRFDPLAGVGFYDNGLHYEQIGGPRYQEIDFSKSLSFSSLADPSSFIVFNSLFLSEFVDNFNHYIEESASTAFDWYTKSGRAMLPSSMQEVAPMGEMIVLPLLKQMWNSNITLDKSLGLESAMVIDFNGTIPGSNLSGKAPRLAIIHELVNREGVSRAWNAFPNMQSILTLALGKANVFVPKMSSENNLELYSLTNYEMGDFMPHFAISSNLWMMNTSPSISKELASKPAKETKNALGAVARINFTSLWNYADDWFNIVKKDSKNILSPSMEKDFQQVSPYVAIGLKLSKGIKSFDIELKEENGQTRISCYLDVKDIPVK